MTESIARSLGDALIEIECPRCGFPFEVELNDALCQVARRCPCCRIRILLREPGGELHGALEEVDAAINRLFE